MDLVNSDSCNLLSKFSFWSPFVHSLDNHDLWLQYAFEWIFKDHTISQLPLLTASSTSSPIIAAATLILFKCSTWSFMMAINGVTTTIYRKWHSILPSFQCTLYLRKKLENKSFSKASRWNCEDIYPADYMFETVPLLFAFSLHVWKVTQRCVFIVASSNSGRDAKSVITAISHFSLWSKMLHCWQKLSKSTNQRVYQDLVYRSTLLLKILTSISAPLSPCSPNFIAFITSHRSPLSECLEQASCRVSSALGVQKYRNIGQSDPKNIGQNPPKLQN